MTKRKKDKQRSTKHTHQTKYRVTRTPLKTNNDLQNIHIKTKYRVTRTPLKIGGELRCSGMVGNSCSTSGTSRVNLVNFTFRYIDDINAQNNSKIDTM